MAIRSDVPRRLNKGSRGGVGRDSLLVLIVGVSAVLPFLLAPLRAQILGPSGRGEFAYFQSSLTTIGVAAALGVRYACYQVGFVGDSRFSISYLRMGLVSTLAASIVIIPLAWTAAASFSPLIFWSIVGTILLAPSFVMNQIEFANANHGQLRSRIGTAASLPAILEFVVTLGAFILQRFSLAVGIFTAVGAQAARLVTAWHWHLSDRSMIRRRERRRVPDTESALFKASLRNGPASVIPLLSGNLDVIIFGMVTTTDVLGHYAVAKLGFSAVLIAATVLEGRAIGLVGKRGRTMALAIILGVAAGLTVLCGAAGWYLTPIVFGQDFGASALAFPILAAAGGLAFTFICLSAINAQRKKASIFPGLIILVVLVISCIGLGTFQGSSVVVISMGLVLAQAVGLSVILIQYYSTNRNDND